MSAVHCRPNKTLGISSDSGKSERHVSNSKIKKEVANRINLGIHEKAVEYFALTSIENLSESEISRLQAITEEAQDNHLLSAIICAIDTISMRLSDETDIDIYRNELLLDSLNIEANNTGDERCYKVDEISRLGTEYFSLVNADKFEDSDFEELERILERANNDSDLSTLIGVIDEMSLQKKDCISGINYVCHEFRKLSLKFRLGLFGFKKRKEPFISVPAVAPSDTNPISYISITRKSSSNTSYLTLEELERM